MKRKAYLFLEISQSEERGRSVYPYLATSFEKAEAKFKQTRSAFEEAHRLEIDAIVWKVIKDYHFLRSYGLLYEHPNGDSYELIVQMVEIDD